MSSAAPLVVAAIIRDLADRAGLGWDQVDEDVRKEIAADWIRLAEEKLRPIAAPGTRIAQDRPLVCFDLEATGVNPAEDRIVEVCFLRREVDGRETVFESLINPERPIPADATEVNGISDAMVADAPTFKVFAPKIVEILGDADLAGFNVLSFDIPLLSAELKRAGIERPTTKRRVVDSYRLFNKKEPHSLAGAVKTYLGRDFEEGHRAEVDVRATLEVLDAQVACYAELPRDVAGVAAWLAEKDPRHVDREGKLRWVGQEAVIAMGKQAGQSLRALARADRGYLEWMTSTKASFPADTVAIVREALAGRFPVRPPPPAEEKPKERERYVPTSGRACCAKAVKVQCVCEGSWDCPDHGKWCFGSHD